MTRSSAWTRCRGTPSGSSPLRRPAEAAAAESTPRRGPWRTPRRRRRRSRPRHRRRSRPSTRQQTGGKERHPAPLERPSGPGVDDQAPDDATAKAIQSLRAGRSRSWGSTTVPTPGTPATASASTPRPVGGGDDRAHPGPRRDLGRRHLRRHPPAAPDRARAARRAPRGVWSTSTISSISEADGSRRGSAESRPSVSVSSTSSSAWTRWATRAASRSLSPKRISSSAMASFSFTIGHDTELEQPLEGAPRLQVLAAVDEVEGRQQHLAGDQSVACRGPRRRRPSGGSGPRPRPPGGSPRPGAGCRHRARARAARPRWRPTTPRRPGGPSTAEPGHLRAQLGDRSRG